MPGRSLLAPLAAGLLALGACADEPPAPPISGGRISGTSATTARAGTGPVTTFDGTYQGTATLNPDRSRRCPDPPPSLEATVRQGRASLVINPVTRQTLSGTVGADGDVRMVDVVDRNVMTTGIFNAISFTGRHQAGVCTYAISLRKL